MTTPKYKSDRTEARKPVAGSVMIKTLCTKCQKPMKCFWPEKTTWGGVECTASEYMAKAILSENVGIYCDDCLETMPDVKLEDLRYE